MTDTQKRLQELLAEQNRTRPNRSFHTWLSELSLFIRMNLGQHSCYQVLLDLINSMYRSDSGIRVIVSKNLDSLFEQLEAVAVDNAFFLSLQDNVPATNPVQDNSKIFIVHGHDESAKDKAELFVRKQGLTPIILVDMDGGGKTIIENIEQHTDVGFAIVLYTPDDAMADGKKRARQNAILEHGYLMARLGRARVRALVKGTVELPSDLGGVVYIPMDNGKEWERRMVMALKNAGYSADANMI